MSKGAVQWITDFELAEAALRHKGFREVTFKGLVPLLGHVIVTLEGEAHRQRRTLEGQLFAVSLLHSLERNLISGVIRSVLDEQRGEGCLVEISYGVMTRIAAQVIGLDGWQAGEQAVTAVHLVSALVGGTQSRHGQREPLTRRAARDELRKQFIDSSISRRRNLLALFQAGKIGRNELPSDLITIILLHHAQAGLKTDTRQIAGEVAFYSVAAIDTTASLVPHLFHELWKFIARFPQHRALLQDPAFLRATAAEALRLHPAIPTIFREATTPLELANNLHFEPGQVAAIYVSEANRDPKIFGADAAEFNPLREIRPKVRRAGLSFGGGVHLCLGRELALGQPENENGLLGIATLLIEALIKKGAQPHPSKPVNELSPYERDVYSTYPIIFT